MSSGHRRMVASALKLANGHYCAPAQYAMISGEKSWHFLTLDACLKFVPPPKTPTTILVNGRAAYVWSDELGKGGYVLVPQLAKCGT